MKHLTTSISCILLLIFLNNDRALAQDRCLVETASGIQNVTYVDFYKVLLELHNSYMSVNNRNGFLETLARNSSMDAVKHWTNSCPDFYYEFNNNNLTPEYSLGTGDRGLDILLGAILDGTGKLSFRDIHPDLKKWVNRARMR